MFLASLTSFGQVGYNIGCVALPSNVLIKQQDGITLAVNKVP